MHKPDPILETSECLLLPNAVHCGTGFKDFLLFKKFFILLGQWKNMVIQDVCAAKTMHPPSSHTRQASTRISSTSHGWQLLRHNTYSMVQAQRYLDTPSHNTHLTIQHKLPRTKMLPQPLCRTACLLSTTPSTSRVCSVNKIITSTRSTTPTEQGPGRKDSE